MRTEVDRQVVDDDAEGKTLAKYSTLTQKLCAANPSAPSRENS